MVVFFTESDLVSFGTYMVSDERTSSLDNNLSQELREERLKNVSDADLANWSHLVQQSQTQQTPVE